MEFFARFETIESLGKGGMGAVYKVRDLVDQREYALKVLKPELTKDRGVTNRFRREFRAMARLDHPHVVRVIDFFEDEEGTVGYTMDLIEGKNLLHVINQDTQVDSKRSFQTVRPLLRYFVQVIQALAYVHRQGLIHRDIKPSNVLIDLNDQAYLADFGLVRRQDHSDSSKDITRSGSVLGTFRYMSPEQARGQEAGHRSDLYSVGVMLYEFLLGQHPFAGKSGMAMGVAHINDAPTPPRELLGDIPEALENLILQCLEKEPFRRPTFAEEILSQIKTLLVQSNPGCEPDTEGSTESSAGARLPVPEFSIGTGASQRAFLMNPNFVGRRDELARISGLLGALLEEESFNLALEGDSGIGKSRLLKEVRDLAELRGIVCFHAVAGEYSQSTLQSIARGVEMTFALERALLPDSDWAILAAWLPSATLAPDLPSTDVPADMLRSRGMELLVALGIKATRAFPILVVLDDVQWMDPESIRVWSYMIQALNKHPRSGAFGVIMTYRLEDRDAPNMTSLLDVIRSGREPTMSLLPFTEEETTDFVQQMLGQKTRPVTFGRRIHQETEGLPFFIEEVMKSLVEEGLIYFDPSEEDPWRAKPELLQEQGYRGLKVPPSVQEVLKRRLKGLPPRAYKLLSVAACIDQEFHFDLLLAASEEDEDSALDWVELFLKRQLLSEADEHGDRFAFHHDKIREVILNDLPKRKQRRIHQKIYEVLLANPQWCSAGDPREDLALHAFHADALENALTYFSEAGFARFEEGSIRRAHGLLQESWTICQTLVEEGSAVDMDRQLNILKSLVSSSILLGKSYELDLWAEEYLQMEMACREGMPRMPSLRMACREVVPGVDPALATEGNYAEMCYFLHEGLFRCHPIGLIVPALAKSWEVLDKGLLYRFQLHPEARFHDGRPVTAEDVKASWERAAGPDNPASGFLHYVFQPIAGADEYMAGDAEEISGIKILGNHTLEVHLHSPVRFFLALLAIHYCAVVPKGSPLKDLVGGPPGAGPYVVQNGEGPLVMKAFKDYHSPLHQPVEQIEPVVYKELKDLKERFAKGQVDLATMTSAQEIRDMSTEDVNVQEQATLNTIYLGMRCDRPPFDNPLVRKALCHAVDHSELTKRSPWNSGIKATGFLPPGMMGYDPDRVGFSYSPKKTRALLETSGFRDGIDVEIFEAEDALVTDHFVTLKALLKDHGIRVHSELLGREAYEERLRKEGRPNLFLWGWIVEYPDPDGFFYSTFHSQNQAVLGIHYSNTKLDSLIERGRAERQFEKRVQIYQQAEKILLEDAPICPIFHTRRAIIWRPEKLSLPVTGLVEPVIRPRNIFPPKT